MAQFFPTSKTTPEIGAGRPRTGVLEIDQVLSFHEAGRQLHLDVETSREDYEQMILIESVEDAVRDADAAALTPATTKLREFLFFVEGR